MAAQFIIDDRENPSQKIRGKQNRRVNKVLFHLLNPPFIDSDGNHVSVDRRSDQDRRNFS